MADISSKHNCSHRIEGILDRITFQNRENGYTIARFEETGKKPKKHFTAVGILTGVPVGSTLSLQGKWIQDSRYGQQFSFTAYSVTKPNTIHGIERYLGSGLVKGIGPAFAGRIVKHFGLDTLDILENEPERLSEVEGLGQKRLETIIRAWQEQKEIHKIMVFLQGHGISATYAVKIFKTYGTAALKVVGENPYRLTEDIWGIGFRRADAIALSTGLPAIDERRARAGLLFALQEAVGDGHCFLNMKELVTTTVRLLELDSEHGPQGEEPALEQLINSQIPNLVQDEKVVVHNNDIYLTSLYYSELGVARNLLNISQGPPLLSKKTTETALQKVSAAMNISLTSEQQQAISISLTNRVAVITGGPGTGKSTILRGLITIFEHAGISFKLAAPTGRAAKRLGEACGREASTIHRLLEFDPSRMDFKRNGNNPLRADWLIVDEASMLDVGLANSLLKALKQGASLLLVGDVDQLPSVGPGNVLRDIIESGCFAVSRLSRIFRQDQGSLISLNASLINQGNQLERLEEYKADKDFYCIYRSTPADIVDEIISLYKGRLQKKFNFDPVRDIQILTPMRKADIGTESLNLQLQKLLSNQTASLQTGGTRFCLGDKVMQIRNNYDKEVFNGDLGIISHIDQEGQQLVVDFEGRKLTYESGELTEIVLAYAITVHKSQGSEFPCVILPIHTVHYPMLQRNLLYTAITRGKQLVLLIGNAKAINMAIRNNRIQQRNSRLKERLQLQDTTL
jgi:exodeoxyribonuclease V alpha subunit